VKTPIHHNSSRTSDTLILLQTHGGVDPALERHWPWLLRGGCDVLVTSPEDDPALRRGLVVGKVIRKVPQDYYRLQERLVMALEKVRGLHGGYKDLLVLHYDSVLLGPVGAKNSPGLDTRLDESKEGFIAPLNSTPPWWFDWETLEKFLKAAALHPINFEGGFLDRWVAAICFLHRIPMTQTSLIGYGRNNVSDDWPEVEKSIRSGFPLVHGIKTEAELKHVLEVAKEVGK